MRYIHTCSDTYSEESDSKVYVCQVIKLNSNVHYHVRWILVEDNRWQHDCFCNSSFVWKFWHANVFRKKKKYFRIRLSVIKFWPRKTELRMKKIFIPARTKNKWKQVARIDTVKSLNVLPCYFFHTVWKKLERQLRDSLAKESKNERQRKERKGQGKAVTVRELQRGTKIWNALRGCRTQVHVHKRYKWACGYRCKIKCTIPTS